jgi:hypothetical protein
MFPLDLSLVHSLTRPHNTPIRRLSVRRPLSLFYWFQACTWAEPTVTSVMVVVIILLSVLLSTPGVVLIASCFDRLLRAPGTCVCTASFVHRALPTSLLRISLRDTNPWLTSLLTLILTLTLTLTLSLTLTYDRCNNPN